MQYYAPQSGYSLVEVLVAISILLLATVGPMTIAARSLQYAEFSSQQNTAYFLAQEGIEAVFKVRADAGIAALSSDPAGDPWTWLGSVLGDCDDANGCGIDWQDETDFVQISNCGSNGESCPIRYADSMSRARYNHSSGDLTPYTRTMYLEDEGSGQIRVRSVVRWDMHPSGEPRTVVLETYLHNIYDYTP
jgi:prepilin-type N-terminal cleavage/methylation domain-containing protein